jgi:hypothetical protein
MTKYSGRFDSVYHRTNGPEGFVEKFIDSWGCIPEYLILYAAI